MLDPRRQLAGLSRFGCARASFPLTDVGHLHAGVEQAEVARVAGILPGEGEVASRKTQGRQSASMEPRHSPQINGATSSRAYYRRLASIRLRRSLQINLLSNGYSTEQIELQ